MDFKEELWRQGLRQGRFIFSRPLGVSMIPNLREGDVISVAPLDRCRVGDVVLFSRGGDLVMHRVVAKFADRIITKGDAVARMDPPIRLQDILGRAVAYERRGKRASLESLASRWWGLAFSLTASWVPLLLPLMGAARRLARERLGLFASGS